MQICEFHGTRCGHVKCECRSAACTDCRHYRLYSGAEPMRLILLASPFKVNWIMEPAAPPTASAFPKGA